MPEDRTEEEEFEITDIDVLTVGLVNKGANGEEFLLLKADDADVDLFDAEAEGDEEEPVGGGNQGLAARFRTFVRGLIQEEVGAALAAPDQTQEVAEMSETVAPVTEEEVEEVQEELQEAAPEETPSLVDVAKKADTVGERVAPTLLARIEVLEKEKKSMREELKKAQETAEAERDARVYREWLEKAQAMPAVPVKAEELAERLHELAKADAGLATWFEEALRAVDAQLRDSGLFVEKGSSKEPGEETLLEKAEKAVAEGKFETLKDAMLALSAADGWDYLRKRRGDLTYAGLKEG